MKFLKTVDAFLTWSCLRSLGKSRILRTSYFWFFAVPIAAKVLSKLNREEALTLFGRNWVLVFELPFSWTCLFFAALAFSVATFTFAWRCPKIIKDFESFRDFYTMGNGVQLIGEWIAGAKAQFERSPYLEQMSAVVERSIVSSGKG